MISKGDRVQNTKTGATGTVISDISYRTNAGRSHKQVTVRWDEANPAGDTDWTVLVRNLVKAS